MTKQQWNQYSVGTRAYCAGGGFYERTSSGWRWCMGREVTEPGLDVIRVVEQQGAAK